MIQGFLGFDQTCGALVSREYTTEITEPTPTCTFLVTARKSTCFLLSTCSVITAQLSVDFNLKPSLPWTSATACRHMGPPCSFRVLPINLLLVVFLTVDGQVFLATKQNSSAKPHILFGIIWKQTKNLFVLVHVLTVVRLLLPHVYDMFDALASIITPANYFRMVMHRIT